MNEGPIVIDLPPEVATKTTDEPRIVKDLLQRVGDTNDYILELDNSRLERFITCARSAEYYIIRQRESRAVKIALKFGGAIHKALEIKYIHGEGEAVRQKENEELIKEFKSIAVPPDDHRTPDRAIEVLQKYHTNYPHELFHVVEQDGHPLVEVRFAEELGTVEVFADLYTYKGGQRSSFRVDRIFVVWTGRIDLIVEWDKQYWVMDHKTTQILGDGYFGDFELSQPTVGYCWAAQRRFGFTIEGLVLNALAVRKPTRTGKANEFHRRRYPYPQWQLAEWQPNTLAVVGRFIADWKDGYFPMETKWCFGKYGRCPYHPICTSRPQDREEVLMGSDYQDVEFDPLKD
jgi:hypothetical protein